MSAATTPPLLFNWQAPRRRNVAIGGFLGFSFAAHIACFYLFQIVYPPTVSLTPAPERVNFISGRSEEGATLLRWVDAQDPALATTTRRPTDARRFLLGKIQHIPSYAENEPALKEAPPLTVDLRIPSAQPPGPVPVRQATKPPTIGSTPTTVTFSGDLRALGQPNFVPTTFKASAHEPPQSAQFRIAVDRQGAVVYCFPLNSSGDAALDEQVRKYLALCRFRSGSNSNGPELTWGIATINWGNDVFESTGKPNTNAP
jgi:hypothetical protein